MRLLYILLLLPLLKTPHISCHDEEEPVEKHSHDEGHGEESGDDKGGHSSKKKIREKLVLCHKPAFFDEARCGDPSKPITRLTPIADLIQLDITKMPFKMDQWIHIDVLPTPEALSAGHELKIKHAYIQMADSKNRVLGRIAEQIPCEATGHPLYKEGNGIISELFQNPGLTGSQVMECQENEDLNYNMNPNVPIIKFSPPVRAFYANFKFTMEEAQMIHDESSTERVCVTTILVDEDEVCYLHHVDQLDGLPAVKEEKREMKVPVPCHSVGPAFKNVQGKTSPFRMNPRLRINMSAIKFLPSPGRRPNSRLISLGSRAYRNKLQVYNNKQYNVDSEGYLPGEKELERKRMHLKVSEMRRPGVPLILMIHPEEPVNDTNTTGTEKGEIQISESLSSQASNSFAYLLPSLLASVLLVSF